jgi:hypothetical protein
VAFSSDRVRWGVIDDARRRQRRQRLIAGGAILVAAVALGVWASDGGGSSTGSHNPAVASRPSAHAPQATLASCLTSQRNGVQGRPSKSLLSILGVLRRPATAADLLPPRVARNVFSGSAVYVHYVRRARIVGDVSYYIYPVVAVGCGQVGAYDAIAVLASHVAFGHGMYGGAGWQGATASQIEHGHAVGGGPPGSKSSSTITLVVPDGVASVTLRYPPGPANGFHKNVIAPAFATTAQVVNNLLVVRAPRTGPAALTKPTMIWRAADGHIIKTFHRL